MHIHLDAVGGVAGDMFVAALLDAWPELAETAIETVQLFMQNQELSLGVEHADDGNLTGSRFCVSMPSCEHKHEHTHWRDIRTRIESSLLSNGIKQHALGIFSELAKAESSVHGTKIDDVAFHEIGNWDSIADILAASAIIDSLSATSWSIGSLPLGSGVVSTAHGELAVPAPATCLLLTGFLCHDDGRPGERVTPTGAAIIRYLNPASTIGTQPRMLSRCGTGFGTRLLAGMSNVLRAIAFEPAKQIANNTDVVAVLQFDIDDQTGEELAAALDLIRSSEHVIDVTQSVVQGKKNRLVCRIHILTKPDSTSTVCELCFEQTTTIGIRVHIENRYVLERQLVSSDQGQIKVVKRPGGLTAKMEMDHANDTTLNHAARVRRRYLLETSTLAELDDENE